jgi:hypothetical protein
MAIKKLAVILLTIVQLAKNPTPITVAALTRRVHGPDADVPISKVIPAAISHTGPVRMWRIVSAVT